MFTGLVEGTGRVAALDRRPEGARLQVSTSLARDLAPGDSLAVNGVCLTVQGARGEEAAFDVGPETLRVTTIGAWQPGRVVNLERPLRADGRLGGHFVQGHVDGAGTLTSVRPEGEAHRLTVSFPESFAPYLVEKGSIAVDGVSLTVAALGGGQFDVMIVPYTWDHTNLSSLRPGDGVNLECDLLGKYVARAMDLSTARMR